MYLIQIFLPLYDNEGKAFEAAMYESVRAELVDRFQGLTAHSRAPVRGLWKDRDDTVRDDLVIYEVMAGELDRHWWKACRAKLEKQFRQEAIVVRAQQVELL